MSVVEPTLTAVPTHEMVLQLATDRQVHAFDLAETFRVALGRHHTNDVQLRSRRVSNYHAEIVNEVEGLFVRDLGSTNGTFVNDESVQRQRLRSGDRLRIGNFSISVRLVPRDESEDPSDGSSPNLFAVGTVGNLLPVRGEAPDSRERSDMALPHLLGGLAQLGATMLVRVRTTNDEGRIFVIDGQVVHCELGAVRKQKALFRLLTVEKGTYELDALPAASAVPQTITTPTDLLMVEGLQQVEALSKLASKLPPLMFEIVLDERCGVAVNTLTADEIAVYECLVRYRTLVRTLEECPMTDFMVMLLTHALLHKGFFRVKGSGGAVLEETMVSGTGR